MDASTTSLLSSIPVPLLGKLILQDGSEFRGLSFGAPISTSGEVVFNTGMMGYPESFTDPSYAGQILACTYPLIGNYGVPAPHFQNNILQHFESEKIHIQGLIAADYSQQHNHWNSHASLSQWLKQNNIPALTGIDTRALTKKLREHGVMLGRIIIGQDIPLVDPNQRNLVAEVSLTEKVTYLRGPKKVVLIDCGMKLNILRNFLQRNITILRVPWDYDFTQEEYDGLFISNGPGDPQQCTATINHLRIALQRDKPIFGICLGNQLLALAAGAKTYKLKYGHRGQNQPCQIVGTKRCFITSQNHGYAVDESTLPPDWEPWFRNANDDTNEGIRHKNKPFFSVQFHPEAAPGPTDTEYLFDEYVRLL